MYSKTELTEIRKQIFPRYNNLKVGRFREKPDNKYFLVSDMNIELESAYLQLKPLSSITDEHRSYLFATDFYVDQMIERNSHMNPIHSDILRSLGYATEQTVILNGKPVTLSVEQQIESLIIETKN